MSKNKIKLLIWLGAALVINAGLILFGLLPYQQKIISLKAEIEGNRQKISNAAEQQSALITSQRQFSDLKNDGFKKINAMFIERQQILAFINTLETLAKEHNITQQITINEQDFAASTNTLPITLSLTGTYYDLIKYLILLEQQNTYFDWEEISLHKLTGFASLNNPNNQGATDALAAEFSLQIYWQP